jgi:hypothetical protein
MNTQMKDGKLLVGDELSDAQKNALEKASMTGSQILDNLDNLNAEIGHKTNTTLPDAKPQVSLAQKGKIIETGDTMDLDRELEELDKKLTQQQVLNKTIKQEETETEEVEETVTEDDALKNQIMELFKNTPDAPGTRQIAAWKQQHGKNGVYVLGMGEGDVYVFTHLKRGQWKKIQEIMAKMQQSAHEGFDAEDELKQKVVQHCVLWPRPLTVEFFYTSRAGVMDAIYQSILMNSYFLTPQQTMMLTTQL